jgi:alanine racemase
LAEAIINLTALSNNLATVKSLAPRSDVVAVIKANAYGHGMLRIAQTLAPRVAVLAVARIDEAMALRQGGIRQRLLVLSSRPDREQLRLCADYGIELVVHDTVTAHLVMGNDTCPALRIWLKIDTGMHRLGVRPTEAATLYRQLKAAPGVDQVILMSHFASADNPDDDTTQQQLRCFDQSTAGIEANRSIANSAAIIHHPGAHREWVRPGIMLYGSNPFGEAAAPALEPVMTLRSDLLAVRDIGPNQGVGYNHIWRSRRATRIGTIAVGYGDGYPRHARNGTPVLVNGQRAPLAGRVSMDTITVDLTEQPQARPGDEVVLWGEGLPVNEIAAHADTIAYDLLTGVSQRVVYRYVESTPRSAVEK